MTSRPPPRTNITRSSCSVRTSRNSMSESWSRRQPVPSQSPRPCPLLSPLCYFHSRLEDTTPFANNPPLPPNLSSGYSFHHHCGCGEARAC